MRLRKMLPNFLKGPAPDEEEDLDPEETERRLQKRLEESGSKPFSADVAKEIGLLQKKRKKQLLDEAEEY